MKMFMSFKKASLPFFSSRSLMSKPQGKAAHRMMLLALALLAATVTSSIAKSRPEEDDEEPEAQWQETAVQFPAPPLDQNLLTFEVSATTTQTFAVVAMSSSGGLDGIVRYTLVARSAACAKTVNFEGFRCQSFESNLYA